MELLPLDLAGLAAARLPTLLRTRPGFLARRIAYSIRAPALSAAAAAQRNRPAHELELQNMLFIVGYWRSGTTLLHELLSGDPRRATPTTHQCFNPQAFESIRAGGRQAERPMDGMAVTADSPQEDEIALVGLGAESPYALWVCPGRMRAEPMLGLEFTPSSEEAWRRVFCRFAGRVSAAAGKPLLLKSPPHTFRILQIARWFPDARFIYIHRDPAEVFASTTAMWAQMVESYSVERCPHEWIEEYVALTRSRLAQMMPGAITQLGSRVACLRFEDLLRSPRDSICEALEQIGEPTSALASSIGQSMERRAGHKRQFVSCDVTLPANAVRVLREALDAYRSGGVS